MSWKTNDSIGQSIQNVIEHVLIYDVCQTRSLGSIIERNFLVVNRKFIFTRMLVSLLLFLFKLEALIVSIQLVLCKVLAVIEMASFPKQILIAASTYQTCTER